MLEPEPEPLPVIGVIFDFLLADNEATPALPPTLNYQAQHEIDNSSQSPQSPPTPSKQNQLLIQAQKQTQTQTQFNEDQDQGLMFIATVNASSQRSVLSCPVNLRRRLSRSSDKLCAPVSFCSIGTLACLGFDLPCLHSFCLDCSCSFTLPLLCHVPSRSNLYRSVPYRTVL